MPGPWRLSLSECSPLPSSLWLPQGTGRQIGIITHGTWVIYSIPHPTKAVGSVLSDVNSSPLSFHPGREKWDHGELKSGPTSLGAEGIKNSKHEEPVPEGIFEFCLYFVELEIKSWHSQVCSSPTQPHWTATHDCYLLSVPHPRAREAF